MSVFNTLISTGCRRKLTGWQAAIVRAMAAATTVWVLYAATLSEMDTLAQTILFLAAMLALMFLMIGPTDGSNEKRVNLPDAVLALVSLITGGYFFLSAQAIAERIALMDPLSQWDVLFGTIILALTIEAMRRTVGLILTIVVLLFVAYNLFGHLLPGVMSHTHITFTHFLDIMAFTRDGLFTTPLRVAATYVFLFVLFGTFLSSVGGGDFFFNLAASISGKTAGGPAKIAVISSGLYGTISGSPTADVVTTGSITIPMMKKINYAPTFAGGVEVAASTGGSLLPPVMGSAAFIMAEITGIDYVDIMVAAFIPALLYYLPIFLQTHLRAKREGLEGIDAKDIPNLWETLRKGGLFVIPLAAITWALLEGYTPTYSAVYGLIAVAAVSLAQKESRRGLMRLYATLADGALRMVSVAGACAAAGLVIGGITMTGLDGKLVTLILGLTDGSLLITLIIAAMVTIILGLGMPTPSAYALAATFLSALFQKLNMPTMNAHLFLLYFAVLSAMTPPVAVAAYAASAIADANPNSIAVQSMRLSVGAFLLPFAFMFDSGLLLQGSALGIALAVLSAAAAMVAISIASEGYLWARLLIPERIVLFGGGICFLHPALYMTAAGIGLACLGLARSVLARLAGPTGKAAG